jgi:four helix bundle protein
VIDVESVSGRRFEDLPVWRRARELTRLIYYETSGHSGFDRDWVLKDQIRKAGVSVVSNIAEGYERDGSRELLQFLSHAKGSCGEVRAQLHPALDCGCLSESTHQELTQRCEEISRMLAGWMRQIKASGLQGRKFR